MNYPIVFKRFEGDVRIRLAVTVMSLLVAVLLWLEPTLFGVVDDDFGQVAIFKYSLFGAGALGTFFLIWKPSVPGPHFIHKYGLEYRSGESEFHIGFEEIQGIELFPLGKESELLLVSIREPQLLIAKQKSRASRIYLRVFQLLYETPVVLHGDRFEIGSQKLKAELQFHWEQASKSRLERKG